jgi:hypothetical protein
MAPQVAVGALMIRTSTVIVLFRPAAQTVSPAKSEVSPGGFGYLPDLIQEQRATSASRIGLCAVHSPGERPFLVAEQASSSKGGGKRGAVQLDEGFPCRLENSSIASAASSLPTPLSPVINTGMTSVRSGRWCPSDGHLLVLR